MAVKKTSLHASERETERVRTLRTAFGETVQALEVHRWKLVDESGATLAMIRRDGRATPGPRVVDHVPVHDGDHSTMLAALGLNGLHAPGVSDGAVHGDILRCWVRESLCPSIQPGDVVLGDHLSAHNVAGLAELITACGARLLPLSPYSPDFNPIEPCWSKLNTYWRRAKARTVDAWFDAIKQALDTITEADIRGWFLPCSYPIP